MTSRNQIQEKINQFKELTRRVDVHGNTYRSISENRFIAIGKAEQHLANGGDPNCQKVLAMLAWS